MRIIGLDVETSKIPNHFPWRKGFYLSTISLNDINNKSKSWVFYHNENRKQCDYDKNFEALKKEGIDIDKVCMQLLDQGLDAFNKAFDDLMKSLS